MKKYRVDAFIHGCHKKRYFSDLRSAESYGEKQNQRGELVFLLKRMPDKLFDVLKIYQ